MELKPTTTQFVREYCLQTKWLWIRVLLQLLKQYNHQAFRSWFSRFLSPPSTLCYKSSTRFPELVRPLFLLLVNFLCCPCYLSMKHFYTQKHTQSFLVYIKGMGMMVLLVFLIFSLCVASNTQFIRSSFHQYHSFLLFSSLPLKIVPFFVFPHQKSETPIYI